ncbi:hypothetical protein CI109_100828 [Kwoniella shandongensis]|uniref:Uncharacterized protein n=1 Tax=Kwoniella shandongensis TaxID=1734106 RepID=A0A5M6BPE4_9TREE|nr:uncharacterized protein CI109_006918 [Kwoniella shandongensis]KAA5524764.1 hypothetical protein CI109_006918 [Kwoniella shandongensis]
MRVFWPTSGLKKHDGVVVGWRVEDTLCVVGIVEEWLAQGIDSDDDGMTTRVIENAPPLTTLGRARAHASRGEKSSTSIVTDEMTFWMADRKGVPSACSAEIELVLYTPPDPGRLRFLTLGRNTSKAGGGSRATQESYSIGAGDKGDDRTLEQVIRLINKSRAAQKTLHDIARKDTMQATRRNLAKPSVDTQAVSILSTTLLPLQVCAQTFINLASYNIANLPSLRESSCTVEQLCLRLQQALDGPQRFLGTREDVEIETWSERYMLFWNTVWLVVNDLILGYWMRIFILDTVQHFAPALVDLYSVYFVETPILALRWLNDWPVGLKLNTPLSQFFCTSLGSLIQKWGEFVTPLLGDIIYTSLVILAASSLGGLTLSLSILGDCFSLLTLHLYVCYRGMKLVYAWQVDSLGGLWNLFRGKRWNVLRQRTDSYEYDVDQLFLGTLLFTVSAFLFPTVLTYAALFVVFRLLIVVAQRTIGIAVTALNAFPLFELMLRVKEPSRLPAGIHMRLVRMKDDSPAPETGVRITHALEIRNSPKSIGDILRR